MQHFTIKIKKGLEVFGIDTPVKGIISRYEIVSINHKKQSINFEVVNFASEKKMNEGEPLILKQFYRPDPKGLRFNHPCVITKERLAVTYNQNGTISDESMSEMKEIIRKDLVKGLKLKDNETE